MAKVTHQSVDSDLRGYGNIKTGLEKLNELESSLAQSMSQLTDISISSRQYGAKGDGSDDTTAIQSTIDYVQSQGKGEVLLFGNHGVSSKITVKQGVSLRFVSGAKLTALINTDILELERNTKLLGQANINTAGVVGYNKSTIVFDGTKHLSYRDIYIDDLFCEGVYATGMGNALHFDCSQANSDISFVKFGRLVVRGFEKAVFFNAPTVSTTLYNYANSNIFENVIISDCDYYIYGTGDHSSGGKNQADGNLFINAALQYSARAKELIHFEGWSNSVEGFAWDSNGKVGLQIVNLTATTKNTDIVLHGSDNPDNYINNGDKNMIQFVDQFHDFVPLKEVPVTAPRWIYRYGGDYQDVLHKANALHTVVETIGSGASVTSGTIADVFDGMTYKNLRLNLAGDTSYSFELTFDGTKYAGFSTSYLYSGLNNLGLTFLAQRLPKSVVIEVTSDTAVVKTTTIDLTNKLNRPTINLIRNSVNGLASHIQKIKVTLIGQQGADVRLGRVYANSPFTGGNKYLSNAGGYMAGELDMFKSALKVGVLSSLPSATVTHRRKIIFLEGATGVADGAYICVKNASDAYEWKLLF